MYLTKEERVLFDGLSEDLTADWKEGVEDETIDAFETPEQMEVRMSMTSYGEYPEVKELLEKAAKNMEEEGNFGLLDFSSLPEGAMHKLFSSLGASGVSAFIELGLGDVKSGEDIEAIALLSQVRHGLLQSNQEFFST